MYVWQAKKGKWFWNCKEVDTLFGMSVGSGEMALKDFIQSPQKDVKNKVFAKLNKYSKEFSEVIELQFIMFLVVSANLIFLWSSI